jgi:hypothetical protein
MRNIKPLRDIVPSSPAVVMLDVSAANGPSAVFDVANMAVAVSSEMMWPTLLKLSRSLREGAVELDGWRLRSEPSRRKWTSQLVLEEIGGSGGYLVSMSLRPRKTEEALDRIREATVDLEREIEAIGDLESRLEKRYYSIMNPSPEVQAIEADTSSYLPEDWSMEINQIACCAFATDGISPSGFDDEGAAPFELDTTAIIGLETTSHMPGMVFSFQPSGLLSIGADPDLPSSRTVGDIGAALGVMHRLGGMVAHIGLASDVSERNERFSGAAYAHFGGASRDAFLELAAGSVHRDGGIMGRETVNAVLGAWSSACGKMVAANATSIGAAIRLLHEAGHVDDDTAYGECNDLLHVEEAAEGRGILWIRTQHHHYRADYVLDDDGILCDLHLSISEGLADLPVPGDPGFLGSYRIDTDGRIRSSSMHDSGLYRGDVMRALNDLTEAVEMAREGLSEDRYERYLLTN